MPVGPDGGAENAREIACAGEQLGDALAGLHFGELEHRGRLAVGVACLVGSGPVGRGDGGGDVGGLGMSGGSRDGQGWQ